ncbi:hypothetical protein HOY80DRAFT_153840 [Tuber brumale]|nr:hypothetical protein HOY80DRAFT_153840 [Tuber brumale]
MSTGRGFFARSAQARSADLLPMQLAAMETARAIWGMVGTEHLENFVVVGGTALLFHGASIIIHGTDLAVTGYSLNRFRELAQNDRRFSETVIGTWEYSSSYGLIVMVDFLNKLGDGGYMHEYNSYSLVGGIPVATLADLAIGKGTSRMDRGHSKDLEGLEYVVQKMTSNGSSFRGLDSEGKRRLDEVMVHLAGDGRGRMLLRLIRALL